MTSAIFISPVLRSREIPNPEAGIILESVWANLRKHGTWDANVGDNDLSAQPSSGQKQVAYLLAFASGVGNLVSTPLINNLSTAWPLACTRALSAAPPNQIEWPGGDVVAQRFAIKIASTPSSGTDNAFNLYGLTLGLVPAAMLPVRGAL